MSHEAWVRQQIDQMLSTLYTIQGKIMGVAESEAALKDAVAKLAAQVSTTQAEIAALKVVPVVDTTAVDAATASVVASTSALAVA